MPKFNGSVQALMQIMESEPIFMPEGYITLAEAIEYAGEHWYSEVWSANKSNLDHLASTKSHYDPEYVSAQTRNDNAQSNACFIASKTLLGYLHDGTVSTFLLTEGQGIIDVPLRFWNTIAALSFINERGVMIDFIGVDFVPVRGVVILKAKELYDLVDKIILNRSDDQSKLENYRNAHNPEYSPYISFMIKASLHFGLVNGQRPDGPRVPKKQIINWLSENWPADLGQLSTTAIENMATFIRHPQDGNGGLTKSIGDKPPLQIEGRKP